MTDWIAGQTPLWWSVSMAIVTTGLGYFIALLGWLSTGGMLGDSTVAISGTSVFVPIILRIDQTVTVTWAGSATYCLGAFRTHPRYSSASTIVREPAWVPRIPVPAHDTGHAVVGSLGIDNHPIAPLSI